MKHVSLTSTLAHASKLAFAALLLAAMTPVLALAEDAAPAAVTAEAAAPAAEKTDAPKEAAKETKPVAKSQKHNIAVVDLQFLVANSKAGASIRDQLDKQRNTYRGQIEKQETDLRKAEQELAAQEGKLTKDDFAKKRKEFQDKVIAAQKSVQDRRLAFDKAYATALEKLREQIVKIVADIAGKNDVALVLNRQEVVLVDAKMDITKEVLEVLDSKVTSIPVNIK